MRTRPHAKGASAFTPGGRGLTPLSRALVVLDHREFQAVEHLAIADNLNLNNPVFAEREAHRPEEPSARRDHHANLSVDNGGLSEPHTLGGFNGLRRPVAGTAQFHRFACRCRCRIHTDHDIRVEHREQSFHISGAQCGKEFANEITLAPNIAAVLRCRPAHPSPRTAGKLPGGFRRAGHDCGNLVKAEIEQVVQNKGEPLRGASRSSTTSSAMPTESASTASCSGSDWAALCSAGSAAVVLSSGSSRCAERELSMSRQTRETTVVSQPRRLSIPSAPERLRRSHASCTASSASASDPSIRYATRADAGGLPRTPAPANGFRPSVTFSRRDSSWG